MKHGQGRTRERQRGWAGLLTLLLALVIVGFVMRAVLKQMSGETAPSPAGPAAAVSGLPGGSSATPAERARAVEAQLQRDADAARRQLESAEQGSPVK